MAWPSGRDSYKTAGEWIIGAISDESGAIEATVAVVAGIAAGSVALVAFGIDSAIEFVAAFTVLRAFRAEQTGRTGLGEQRPLRVIGVTFFLLAAYILW